MRYYVIRKKILRIKPTPLAKVSDRIIFLMTKNQISYVAACWLDAAEKSKETININLNKLNRIINS